MATKKTKKVVVKFPDTIYLTRDEWLDTGEEYFLTNKTIGECATDNPVLVGVYQLVGIKNVTKKVEIVTEDVNG